MSQLANPPKLNPINPAAGPCDNPIAAHSQRNPTPRPQSAPPPLHIYPYENSLFVSQLPQDRISRRRLRVIVKLAGQKMASSRAIPNHADLKPYSHAVAGHDGTMCDPDGELFIKPCTKQEIQFYETAIRDHKAFASLMPVYIGTLALNDVTDAQSINEQLPAVSEHISAEMKEEALRVAKEAATAAPTSENGIPVEWKPNKNRKIPTNTSVVLENAAYGFKRPNILDAKLGSRLWADDAPLEKRRRFDEITKVTTNGSHGFRIAGMRVYKGSENPDDLDSEGYMVYGKDYGRSTVTAQNVVSEMRRFIFNAQAGVDEDLGRVIAGAFLQDLKHVEEVLAAEESRMYSASLLFTFEGDGEALRAAIEQTLPSASPSLQEADTKEIIGRLPGLSTSRVDSGIVMDDDGEIITGADEKFELTSNGHVILGGTEIVLPSPIMEHVKVLELADDGTFETPAELSELDDEFDDDEMSSLPRIYSLKLIDFAHATWVPGQGPDENVLFGVRSLIKIFEELAD